MGLSWIFLNSDLIVTECPGRRANVLIDSAIRNITFIHIFHNESREASRWPSGNGQELIEYFLQRRNSGF